MNICLSVQSIPPFSLLFRQRGKQSRQAGLAPLAARQGPHLSLTPGPASRQTATQPAETATQSISHWRQAYCNCISYHRSGRCCTRLRFSGWIHDDWYTISKRNFRYLLSRSYPNTWTRGYSGSYTCNCHDTTTCRRRRWWY